MNTIAIIDDDIYIGNMLEELLQGEGYNILRAYSGTEALLLLSQNKPDLVLLDLMLPGLSGKKCCPKSRVSHPLWSAPRWMCRIRSSCCWAARPTT